MRYVLLHHRTPPGYPRPNHWDFMLETTEGDLWTWALEEEPVAGRTIAAERLANHRAAYLTYEGPVSGDRGEVRRIDAGTYELLAESNAEFVVRLSGDQLGGRLRLSKEETAPDAQRWIVDCSGLSNSGSSAAR